MFKSIEHDAATGLGWGLGFLAALLLFIFLSWALNDITGFNLEDKLKKLQCT